MQEINRNKLIRELRGNCMCLTYADDCSKCAEKYPELCKKERKLFKAAADMLEADAAKDMNVPSKWVSVKDRLPEVVSTRKAGENIYRRSARVLCACLQADGRRMVKEGYMEYFNDYPKPNWIIPGTIHSVTHWMPLPEAPKEEADAD